MSTIFGLFCYLLTWSVLREHGYLLSLNESFALSFFCVFVVGPGIFELFKR